MPEFQIDYGTSEGASKYGELDEFTRGYVEAMFFADTPEAESWSVADMSDDAWQRVTADCTAFQERHADDLQKAYDRGMPRCVAYEPIQAGRDFWFTRQGHGVGFWDRELGGIGETLAKHARAFGECWPYQGDGDGKIYF